MKLRLTPKEYKLAEFICSQRRIQFQIIKNINDRYKKPDMKKVIENFPYEQGKLIPYTKNDPDNLDCGLLYLDLETKTDFVNDIKALLEAYQSRTSSVEENKNGDAVVAHTLLKKIENQT